MATVEELGLLGVEVAQVKEKETEALALPGRRQLKVSQHPR